MENVDEDGVQVKAVLDKEGREVGDPTPMAPPAGLSKPKSMAEQIKEMVRRELSERAADMGFESFEESDDFNIPDDPLDPKTPYEAVFDPPPPVEKEMEDGSSSVDEGRKQPDSDGTGKSGKVPKNKSKSQSDVQGSGSKADSGDPEPEE